MFVKTVEVDGGVKECDYVMSRLSSWMKPENKGVPLVALKDSSCYTIREPYGVVLIIGPWNYPITQVASCSV